MIGLSVAPFRQAPLLVVVQLLFDISTYLIFPMRSNAVLFHEPRRHVQAPRRRAREADGRAVNSF